MGVFFHTLRCDAARLSQRKPDEIGVIHLLMKLVNPRFLPVFLIRLAAAVWRHTLFKPFGLLLTWLNFLLFGIECTPRCQIGPGLMLPHTSGTVIGAVSIGTNATIFQGVTLGAREADLGFTAETRPEVGDNVIIGAGAKVLGGIKLGNGSQIGANAVVIEDVPGNGVAVGIPAKVVKVLDNV